MFHPSLASILRVQWLTWIPQGQSAELFVTPLHPTRAVCSGRGCANPPVRNHSNLHLLSLPTKPGFSQCRKPCDSSCRVASLFCGTGYSSNISEHKANMNSTLAEAQRPLRTSPGCISSLTELSEEPHALRSRLPRNPMAEPC